LHYSEDVNKETNSAAEFIANLDGAPGHPGHYIKLSARTDGSFTITNERNGFTREYPAVTRARSSPASGEKP